MTLTSTLPVRGVHIARLMQNVASTARDYAVSARATAKVAPEIRTLLARGESGAGTAAATAYDAVTLLKARADALAAARAELHTALSDARFAVGALKGAPGASAQAIVDGAYETTRLEAKSVQRSIPGVIRNFEALREAGGWTTVATMVGAGFGTGAAVLGSQFDTQLMAEVLPGFAASGAAVGAIAGVPLGLRVAGGTSKFAGMLDTAVTRAAASDAGVGAWVDAVPLRRVIKRIEGTASDAERLAARADALAREFPDTFMNAVLDAEHASKHGGSLQRARAEAKAVVDGAAAERRAAITAATVDARSVLGLEPEPVPVAEVVR